MFSVWLWQQMRSWHLSFTNSPAAVGGVSGPEAVRQWRAASRGEGPSFVILDCRVSALQLPTLPLLCCLACHALPATPRRTREEMCPREVYPLGVL